MYGGVLHNFLMKRLRRRHEDAKDVAQDVYVRLLKLSQAERVKDPPALMYLIAKQVIAARWAKDSRSPLVDDPDGLAASLHADERTPERLVEAQSELSQAGRFIRRLNDAHRRALVLKLEGNSNAEIAAELKLSEHTVKKYLCEANADIRARKGRRARKHGSRPREAATTAAAAAAAAETDPPPGAVPKDDESWTTQSPSKEGTS